MPTQALPPASLWDQFAVVGVIVLCFILAAFAIWKVATYLTGYQKEREGVWQNFISEELEKQRCSDSDQRKEDRENWERFFKERGESEKQRDTLFAQQITELVRMIGHLKDEIASLRGDFDKHDQTERTYMQAWADITTQQRKRSKQQLDDEA